jgi:hypothetical protein
MITKQQLEQRLGGLKKLLEAKRGEIVRAQAEIVRIGAAAEECAFWLSKFEEKPKKKT